MSSITSGSLKRRVTSYGGNHAMRVALITPRFLPDLGGLEVHVGSLARRLVAAGHSVEVMTQASPSARRIDQLDGATVRRSAQPRSAQPRSAPPRSALPRIARGPGARA